MNTLFSLIAYVESLGNPYAMRFEDGVYVRRLTPGKFDGDIVARIRRVNACSLATAHMIYSTSWGMCQVMGFNLYAPQLNLTMPVGQYLSNVNEQQKTFEDFIRWKELDIFDYDDLINKRTARVKFGAIYNGDGAAYADAIERSLREQGIRYGN